MDLIAQGQAMHTPEQTFTIADRFEQLAAEDGDRVFLIDGEREVSFAQLNSQANRYAYLARQLGLETGDTGAVMMQNRPEFFFAWVGLAKAGITAVMVNSYSKGKALAHALNITNSQLLYVGQECLENFDGQSGLLGERPSLVIEDGIDCALPATARWISPLVKALPDDNPPRQWREGIIGKMPAFHCFTSGTTGLPKAAIISHARWLSVGTGWNKLLGITRDDVFYCILPLFHGAAGMSLTSNAVGAGARMVLRRKFSASEFWNDVRRHGITTTQYIGEITRYLVNRPACDNDRDHSLKHMTGAGMTADVWQKFVDRFGGINIYEGLGATESNCGISNVDGRIGSIGRIPFKEKSNARVVKYNVEDDCHLRDENDHLIEIKAGEVGELIGMILELPGVMGGRFEGYTDPQASEAKVLRNVFRDGDAWFSTGDLVTCDEEDYFYFVDRIGDTFRWKSENVSTTEATEALAPFDDAEIINIYGVRVPDYEGRAGMAAIQMKDGRAFDPDLFYRIATEQLPHYAVPLFLRVSSQSDLTPTFKLRKVDLQKQGYDPNCFSDPLYLLNHRDNTYSPYSEPGLVQLDVAPFETN
jgi:fatty-acyl-CoA synthase